MSSLAMKSMRNVLAHQNHVFLTRSFSSNDGEKAFEKLFLSNCDSTSSSIAKNAKILNKRRHSSDKWEEVCFTDAHTTVIGLNQPKVYCKLMGIVRGRNEGRLRFELEILSLNCWEPSTKLNRSQTLLYFLQLSMFLLQKYHF